VGGCLRGGTGDGGSRAFLRGLSKGGEGFFLVAAASAVAANNAQATIARQTILDTFILISVMSKKYIFQNRGAANRNYLVLITH
jgi:hypothetical protein